MVDRDVLFGKVDALKRHLARIHEKNGVDFKEFLANRDVQDILLFNIGQAIQNCIDIAAHVVSEEGLGIAGSNSEMFYLLQEGGVINAETVENMVGAVGFRNVLAHQYAGLDWETAYQVATVRYRDLEEFAGAVLYKFGLLHDE